MAIFLLNNREIEMNNITSIEKTDYSSIEKKLEKLLKCHCIVSDIGLEDISDFEGNQYKAYVVFMTADDMYKSYLIIKNNELYISEPKIE